MKQRLRTLGLDLAALAFLVGLLVVLVHGMTALTVWADRLMGWIP